MSEHLDGKALRMAGASVVDSMELLKIVAELNRLADERVAAARLDAARKVRDYLMEPYQHPGVDRDPARVLQRFIEETKDDAALARIVDGEPDKEEA
jgi:hypothetical protein